MPRARYTLRISGPIPAELLRELGVLHVKLEPAATLLNATLPDQATLFALIENLEQHGVHVMEVRSLVDDTPRERSDSPEQGDAEAPKPDHDPPTTRIQEA
jgi:hypothetical protein